MNQRQVKGMVDKQIRRLTKGRPEDRPSQWAKWRFIAPRALEGWVGRWGRRKRKELV